MAFAGGVAASLAGLETRLAAAEAAAAASKPSFFSGNGAPAAGLGTNGDHYVDLDIGLLYKKAAGSWASTNFQLWTA